MMGAALLYLAPCLAVARFVPWKGTPTAASHKQKGRTHFMGAASNILSAAPTRPSQLLTIHC